MLSRHAQLNTIPRKACTRAREQAGGASGLGWALRLHARQRDNILWRHAARGDEDVERRAAPEGILGDGCLSHLGDEDERMKSVKTYQRRRCGGLKESVCH